MYVDISGSRIRILDISSWFWGEVSCRIQNSRSKNAEFDVQGPKFRTFTDSMIFDMTFFLLCSVLHSKLFRGRGTP